MVQINFIYNFPNHYGNLNHSFYIVEHNVGLYKIEKKKRKFFFPKELLPSSRLKKKRFSCNLKIKITS